MLKNMLEQINKTPRMHGTLFICWGVALVEAIAGGNFQPYLAASFCICALIDFGK